MTNWLSKEKHVWYVLQFSIHQTSQFLSMILISTGTVVIADGELLLFFL